MSLTVQGSAHVLLVLITIFGCHCVRVKHSEYQKSWRVPDDIEADWPSPDQVYFDLGESLDGKMLRNIVILQTEKHHDSLT